MSNFDKGNFDKNKTNQQNTNRPTGGGQGQGQGKPYNPNQPHGGSNKPTQPGQEKQPWDKK